MSPVTIESVYLENGHLRICVKPTRFADYEYIYRTASSVRWDKVTSTLFVLPSVGYSPSREFQHIKAAVLSEYDDELAIGPETRLDGLSDELISQLT